MGKAMSFADGLLPGGGGVTDDILGAPAKATFGKAIQDWQAANEKSIKMLGETNDRTVDKLLTGLNALRADVSFDIDKLSDSLANTVASLDESLDRNITSLDSNLTGQTSRLDTIFEKQTNTFFFLGRVFLTVLICGGCFFGLYQVAASLQNFVSYKRAFQEKKVPLTAIFFLGLGGLILTWVWPDPAKLGELEDQYSGSYAKALEFEDFPQAYTSAAQLVVIDQSNKSYRGNEIKARAFRDFFLRPTGILDDQRLGTLFGMLAQADEYHKEYADVSDPDIMSLYALIGSIRADNPGAVMSSAVATAEAYRLYNEKGNADEVHLPALKVQTAHALLKLRKISLPPEFVDIAITGSMPNYSENEQAFIDQYKKFLAIELPREVLREKDHGLGSVSSVSQFGSLLDNQLTVRRFYAELTAQYTRYLISQSIARAPGGSSEQAGVATKNYCKIFEFYRDWYNNNFDKFSEDPTFVANYLEGPFLILSRATAVYGDSSSACTKLSAADIAKFGDQVNLWTNSLQNHLGQNKKVGVNLMKSAANASAVFQLAALAEFEKTTLDAGSLLISGAASDTPSQEKLLDLVEKSAMLGFYSFDADNNVVPMPYGLYRMFGTTGLSTKTLWRTNFIRFLQSNWG